MKKFTEWLQERQDEGILDGLGIGSSRKAKSTRERISRSFQDADWEKRRKYQRQSDQWRHQKRLINQENKEKAKLVWDSMPKELQDKLESNLKFIGTNDDGFGNKWTISADNLKDAIQKTYGVGWCDSEGCTIEFEYKDSDTTVYVSNWSNGWGTPPAIIEVTHKGQKFKWKI